MKLPRQVSAEAKNIDAQFNELGGFTLGSQMESEARETPLRVLVIEDDDAVAKVVGMCLGAAGFEARHTATGEDALRMMYLEPPDAVVLDLSLPDRLGGEILTWLRHHADHGGPAWIVISALDLEEATDRYGLLEREFLSKPFNPWDVVRILEQSLGK